MDKSESNPLCGGGRTMLWCSKGNLKAILEKECARQYQTKTDFVISLCSASRPGEEN